MLLVEHLIATEKKGNLVSVTNRSGNSLESVKKLNLKVLCCGKVFTAPVLEE